MLMKHTISFLLLWLCAGMVHAQEWQWSVPVNSAVSSETNDHPRAFLWIPPSCRQVKAVVIGQHNMIEEGILEHPHFRKEMAALGIAEIWVTPGLNFVFDFTKGAGEPFNDMLKTLAAVSGYTELAWAPVVPIGHSAAASYPWNFAAWDPARTLAILSIHGDAPLTNLTGSGKPNPDWGDRHINGIPGLMVMGEYEWWDDRLLPAISFRQKYPDAAVSLLADAGYGHFDYSDDLVAYLALFIRKAAAYRLPTVAPLDSPITLKPIHPQQGWLVDRWRMDSSLYAKAAPYEEFAGNKSEAFWYFDKEMALRTEAYYAKSRGKRLQALGFEQQGKLVAEVAAHARVNLRFLPEADGITFHLKGFFRDSATDKTGKPASPVGHGKGKVTIIRICGPVKKINDTTFCVSFYRMGFNNPKRSGDIWLLASHPGDQQYKSAVQQANMRIPVKNSTGKAQQITFAPIADQQAGVKSLKLTATSNSGMPVSYYVKEGPAMIAGNRIQFTRLPPRSLYPVKVTIVAWQYGRSQEPAIRSAEPVEQSFYILK